MTQLILSRHWNPKEIGSNVSKGMDLPVRQEQGTEQSLPSSTSSHRLPAQGEAQIKGVVFPPQDPNPRHASSSKIHVKDFDKKRV